MDIDLHGRELAEAVVEVFQGLAECKEMGDQFLNIVHGHTHGQTLQQYFRSEKFRASIRRSGYKIKDIIPLSPAITRIVL